MKILYFSCHEVLSRDECTILHELGHTIFSPDDRVCEDNKGDNNLRPGVKGLVYDPEDEAEWHRIAVQPNKERKECLTKEFVNRFDILIFMHMPDWVISNWDAIRHKRVILRTIGQLIAPQEARLKPYKMMMGLKVIRYSPKERTTPNFCGEDVLIRFYKDPNEYHSWNGEINTVITVAQSMRKRGNHCGYEFFANECPKVCKPILFGVGNEDSQFNGGKLSFSDLKKVLQDYRAFFYAGTHPASYTLAFIEAFMTGIPIVAIGPKAGNANWLPNHNLWEIDSLIDNEINGFWSDREEDRVDYMKSLLESDSLAAGISVNAQKKAIEIFGKEKIKAQWKEFLDSLDI